jgi:hypothetical protein
MPAAAPEAPPAGGAPIPGAFDPVAFEAKLNAMFNGFAASLKKDVTKMLKKPADPPAGDPPVVDPPAQESKTIAELNLRLAQNEKKQKEIADLLAASQKETETAKQAAAEEKRIGAFQTAIADIPFANPKARQQFTDAYIGKVKYAEDGSLIVDTPNGPVGHDVFLKMEAENSPHFLEPQGHGGAGATGGKKPMGAPKINVLDMTTEQLINMPKGDLNGAMAAALAATTRGG